MAKEIVFNLETENAMFGLLRFMDVRFKECPGGSENRKKLLEEFKNYVADNELKSGSICKCNCTTDISDEEIVFNVCLTCKGMPYKDFLDERLSPCDRDKVTIKQ